MTTNYTILEKSEIELKQSFNEFLELSYKIYSKVKNFLKEDKITETTIHKMQEYKLTAKEKKRDIRDDCIWIISKDQPQSNHLRFIIAVLYSIVDLERIIEQSYNIIWYFKSISLNLPLKQIINDSMEFSGNIFFEIKKFFIQKDVTKHGEKIIQYLEKFKEHYKSSLLDAFKHSFEIEKNELEHIYLFSIIMKYIERTMDHLNSIFKNFSRIKNKD